jgi:hypothetical protein
VTLAVALVEAPVGILEPGRRVHVGVEHEGFAVERGGGVVRLRSAREQNDRERTERD